MFLYLWLLVSTARDLLRSRRDLAFELVILRYQLAVLARPSRRRHIRPADRVVLSWLARRWTGWRSALLLVQPDTVVRWHGTDRRRYWTRKSRSSAGRPRIPVEVRELIRRMARENQRWGSVRIQGGLRKLGYHVSARSVRRYRRAVKRVRARWTGMKAAMRSEGIPLWSPGTRPAVRDFDEAASR